MMSIVQGAKPKQKFLMIPEGIVTLRHETLSHYANKPMQYVEFCKAVNVENFFGKIVIFSMIMHKT